MRKLWGRVTSLNVQKVAWVLAETQLTYERIDVGGAYGGLKTDAYREMNPNGRIPTLMDEGMILWESNAICRYIVQRYGGGLDQGSAIKNAQADMWMEWFQNNVYAAFMGMFRQMVRMTDSTRDEAALQQAIERLHQQFTIAEDALARNPFLLGDQPSLADVPFGSCLYRYYTLDIDHGRFPNIQAYYERLTQHAPYRDHVMVDYSSLYGVTN